MMSGQKQDLQTLDLHALMLCLKGRFSCKISGWSAQCRLGEPSNFLFRQGSKDANDKLAIFLVC